jgi:serine/threonine protein kinase
MADGDSKARFQREALAVTSINHPNIITIYEVGQFQERLFIAMESVEGESLSEIIKKGELSFTEITDITA